MNISAERIKTRAAITAADLMFLLRGSHSIANLSSSPEKYDRGYQKLVFKQIEQAFFWHLSIPGSFVNSGHFIT